MRLQYWLRSLAKQKSLQRSVNFSKILQITSYGGKIHQLALNLDLRGHWVQASLMTRCLRPTFSLLTE